MTPATNGTPVEPRVPQDTWQEWVAGWNRFWFAPAEPTIPALMRIFCGLLTLYVHLSYGVALLAYIGPEGWTDKSVGDWMRNKIEFRAQPLDWQGLPGEPQRGFTTWSVWFHLDSPAWIWAIYSIFILAMVCYTVGFCTRLSGIITWIATLSFTNRIPNLMFGMDAMMVIVQTYLLIAPSGLMYSVDSWLAKRRFGWWRDDTFDPAHPPKTITANLAIRLLQIHFCWVYAVSGMSKLEGTSWWSGEAIWAVIANPNFSPMQSSLYMNFLIFLSHHRWLYHLVIGGAVLYTLVLELGFPALVWPRRTRWIMISGSVLLHTGIGFMMGLGGFSLFMLVFVMSFIPPETAVAFLNELHGRWQEITAKYAGRRNKSGPALEKKQREELALQR
jgi:hypothetical protein